MQTAPYSEAGLRAIVRSLCDMPGALLPVLHRIQNEFGYVPGESVGPIADELNLSRAEVHGVLSFYHDFRREPPADHVIEICRAEACQAVGARTLQASLENMFSTKVGDRSSDGEVSLKAVYCLGNCACAPNVKIDGAIYGRASAEGVTELLARHIRRRSIDDGKIE